MYWYQYQTHGKREEMCEVYPECKHIGINTKRLESEKKRMRRVTCYSMLFAIISVLADAMFVDVARTSEYPTSCSMFMSV